MAYGTVALVARVFVDIVVRLRGPHRAHGERCRVGVRIVDGNPVFDHFRVYASDSLGRSQAAAVRAAADARPVREAPAFDDQGVTVPVAATVTRELLDVLEVRPVVERNHAGLVNHLVRDGNRAGTLEDADAVTVDCCAHAAADTERDAAVV